MSIYKENIALLTQLYQENNKNITKTAEAFAEKIGLPYKDNVRRVISNHVSKEIDPKQELESDDYKMAQTREIAKKQTYIITHAQNNTPVHKKFFEKVKAYQNFRDAELVVIAGRYKNPTSIFQDKKEDFWVKEVLPYLSAKREKIHKNLVILGDIKIQATSSRPLARKELISGDDSCVVGHPRVHLKSVDRLPTYEPKIMFSTGSVTLPNYTDSDTGKVAEAHHTLGFLIVEIDGENFHARQVTAEPNGDFIDFNWRVSEQGITRNEKVKAVVLGDVHYKNADKTLLQTIEQKILKRFKPENTVLHDLFDGTSVNHHAQKDPFYQYNLLKNGDNSLKKELTEIKHFLVNWQDYNPVIVRSNHDEWLDKYLVERDWKKDIENAELYFEYALIKLQGKDPKGIFPYIVDNWQIPNVRTLGINESFKPCAFELGIHGHLGSGGAKGTNNTFKRLSTKIIKNHDHTVFREDGVLSSGTCTKYDLGYNKGLTNWVQSITIEHDNGKAQQIIFKKNYTFEKQTDTSMV